MTIPTIDGRAACVNSCAMSMSFYPTNARPAKQPAPKTWKLRSDELSELVPLVVVKLGRRRSNGAARERTIP